MKKVIALLLVLTILMLGCQPSEKALTPTKVQLKWQHQAQFAGNYVAKEKGFYEDKSIDIIELSEFDFTNFPINQVQNKESDFGITGADELLIAKDKGEAQDVKAIAVIYKINPVALYSLKESGIEKPQDLIGKTVGIERAADGSDINIGILYKAMLHRLDIDPTQINEITIGYDATELLAGETDISSGYVINEPHQAIEAGENVNIILIAEYGVNIYADVLIVHQDTIDQSPEYVENFLKATLDGWQYAIENEEEAVDIVLKYTTDRTKSHESYMLRSSIPLIHTGETPLGWMQAEDWEDAQELLFEEDVLTTKTPLEEVYTMEFLNKIYS